MYPWCTQNSWRISIGAYGIFCGTQVYMGVVEGNVFGDYVTKVSASLQIWDKQFGGSQPTWIVRYVEMFKLVACYQIVNHF